MAMRYLAGKLRAPAPAAAALRRPRSLSANASQSQVGSPLDSSQIVRFDRPRSGKYTNGSTTELASSMKVVKNVDETIRQLHEEVAKMEAASKEIAEIIRYNRFHRRCIMGSVVLGVGLAGVSCVRYTRSYRKALREYYVVGLEMENKYSPRTPN
ncbi:uncharacterized protein [Oryza sativa Japonica Group]|uniref:uncharacterized protein isoform X1 n=1 Tax=Oryza sativa subsp. japonica TaxID=39947 RepID=UPI0007753627|nr:uncharacterized protein LOC107277032 isoform X1 [Oryza sativa Japonica Group]